MLPCYFWIPVLSRPLSSLYYRHIMYYKRVLYNYFLIYRFDVATSSWINIYRSPTCARLIMRKFGALVLVLDNGAFLAVSIVLRLICLVSNSRHVRELYFAQHTMLFCRNWRYWRRALPMAALQTAFPWRQRGDSALSLLRSGLNSYIFMRFLVLWLRASIARHSPTTIHIFF